MRGGTSTGADFREAARHEHELNERQREVLALHLYRGLDDRAIASLLGCSYDDVKMNLSLARKKLKEELLMSISGLSQQMAALNIGAKE